MSDKTAPIGICDHCGGKIHPDEHSTTPAAACAATAASIAKTPQTARTANPSAARRPNFERSRHTVDELESWPSDACSHIRESSGRQLRRINYQINAGMVLDDDLPAMERRARALKEQFETIVIPAPARTVEAGERLVRLRQIWPTASKYIRREIVQAMCAAVIVDTERRRIVGIRPHPEFIVLFDRTRLTRDGNVWRI